MFSNTTGANNTAVGNNSLRTNTTGGQNAAFGYWALYENTTASNNAAFGNQAMQNNTTGTGNIALGYESLKANTTASNNTAVGHQALLANTTAGNNVAVGYNAGASITTNDYNTIIGSGANSKSDNTTDEYQIAIGSDCMSVGGNFVTLGKGTGSDRIYNGFTSNASWTRTSDERYKKDIQTNTDCGLAFINDLRTVTYKWKSKSELDSSFPDYDATKTTSEYTDKMYGLIAQEVKTALDNNNITDFGGWSSITNAGHTQQGISQEMFIHPLIKAIQELSTENKALLVRIEALEA
jgi:carbonic anhydrase/acetyltransferase-like protein (isoleucine patch superfamily)